ncbi:hypothetical protein NT6N_18630 [Oceaniferula spumae]|uniref:DUF3592 domain-containing protein n=1 Tax=Oceaniferula spumae TaxID=2979115 RepID=A0AAT9FLJ4_9BACT
MAKAKKSSGGCGLYGFAIFWTLFSSIFLIIGLKTCYDGFTRSQWPEVECMVHSFTITDKRSGDPPFQPKTSYTYEWEGVTHSGSTVWPSKKGEDDYEDLAELLEQYRAGEFKSCYVNPKAPTESALFVGGEDIWGGLIFALMGGLFVAIGIGLIVVGRREKKQESAALSSKKTKTDEAPAAILIPFFSVFGLAGLGLLFFLIIPQAMKYFDAKGWEETPAKVVWSAVRSHDSDDGTTYSVDIFYRYEFDGREYKSNTTGLMSGSSSGRSSKQEKVKNHPPGKEIVCYVNPDKPWQALLERDLGWWALFALFPLPFIAIGVGGLWWMLRKRNKSNKTSKYDNPLGRRTSQLRHSADKKDIYHGSHKPTKASVDFAPRGNRIKSFIGVFIFAVFWNGITSIFVAIAAGSWLRDDPEWFLTIFIIPFVLIGLCALLFSVYQFFALFGPAPTITLKPSAIPFDKEATVSWKLLSGANRINHFAVYLIGEEEAKYQRGTDTKTATETFHEQALIETQDPRKMKRGSATIDLSEITTPIMPSWKSSNNKIKWSILVHGKISFWPDINDRYEIEVHPLDVTPNN